jgi:hypothetical protein
MNADEVLARHRERLMAAPGVVGVGLGARAGRPVILVMLDRPAARLSQPLPPDLEGVPVVPEEVGEVTAF